MAHLNKCLFIGRLTRDAELKYTPEGAGVLNFRLAMNERWKDKAGQEREEKCFFDIAWWPKNPENVKQYLTKGAQVFVEGKLQMREGEGKDGGQRTWYSCRADKVQFFWDGEKKEPGEQQAAAASDPPF